MSLAITHLPYYNSPFNILPYFLYVNKILILLASFPTNINDHYSIFNSALMGFIGMAHAGGILVNLVLALPFMMSNYIFGIYIGLWTLFAFVPGFRSGIVDRFYGKRAFYLIHLALLILNQYNRAIAVLKFEESLEKMPGMIKGFDNLVGIATLSTLASATGTLLSSTLRPYLYRSYRVRPTNYFAVLWIFGLMLWYGFCRQWHLSSMTFIIQVFQSWGFTSVENVLEGFFEHVWKAILGGALQLVQFLSSFLPESLIKQANNFLVHSLSLTLTQVLPENFSKTLSEVVWTAKDDVVIGYLIYPLVEIIFNLSFWRLFYRASPNSLEKKNQ